MYFFCVGCIDSGKIVLTPGATEKDLNFCWYSKTKGLAKVKLGKKEDLSDAKVYDGTVTESTVPIVWRLTKLPTKYP